MFLLKIIYFLQTCRKIAWQLHFRSIAAAFFEGPLEIQKIANLQLKMQQNAAAVLVGLEFKAVFAKNHVFLAKM